MLKFLRAKNVELQLKFKSGNRLLGLNQQQIDENEAKRRKLVDEFPELAATAPVLGVDPGNPQMLLNPASDKIAREAKIKMTKAKIAILESHLVEIKKQFQLEYDIGADIEKLERQKGIDEKEYLSLESNLKTAKMNGTLDPSRMPNITIVQQPSRPVKTYDELTQKIILGLAGGGIALGVGIAFLIELLFQRRVVRPIEIQTRLQLPLLLSIPFIRRKERGGLMMGRSASIPNIGNVDDEALSTPGVRRNRLRKHDSEVAALHSPLFGNHPGPHDFQLRDQQRDPQTEDGGCHRTFGRGRFVDHCRRTGKVVLGNSGDEGPAGGFELGSSRGKSDVRRDPESIVERSPASGNHLEVQGERSESLFCGCHRPPGRCRTDDVLTGALVSTHAPTPG